jgi:quercetin dioxygenase-like cupin family protein
MSFHPAKNRTIGYRSEIFDPSLIHFCVFIELQVLGPHREIFSMNATSETKTATSRGADQQTFIVLGVLLQFLSTPEQVNDQISVMRGTVPSGVVIPLHSHAEPEIFYVLNGSLEVFQSEGWQTVTAGEVVSIPGNVRHALRNTSPSPITSIIVSKQELYSFFRELARPFDPNSPPAPPTPEEMQQLFSVAEKYEYWLASRDENAAIGISLW